MPDIGEKVSVIAVFGISPGLRPLRFKWSGRRVDIKEVTYEWTTHEGQSRLLHFSVSDGNTLYELSFDTNEISWKLEGIETDM